MSNHQGCSIEKIVVEFHKIHWKIPVPDTLAQVFSCEFCEISKKTFFTEHLITTPSIITICSKIDIKIEIARQYSRYLIFICITKNLSL